MIIKLKHWDVLQSKNISFYYFIGVMLSFKNKFNIVDSQK